MANVALFSWPVVALILFAAMGREKGLIWSVILGYLLLPENISFELPGLPNYAKSPAIALSVLLGALCFGTKLSWPDLPRPERHEKDRARLALMGLLALIVIGSYMTVRDNGYPLIDADRVRAGMTLRDLFSNISNLLITLTPLFLAWRWLCASRHHEEILRVLVIMGVVYSILALYEMRMSPQINRTVYGFFPHAWLQHVRGGQFRPVVFLQHGLWLAFFLLTASFAAFGLFRSLKNSANRVLYLMAGLWMLSVLFISPNLGAAVLAVVFGPPLLMSSQGIQTRIVTVTAVFFLIFPGVRQADFLPLDSVLSAVESISAERAQSLQFRVENEDMILEQASAKSVFGWGDWGRWRVINEKGRDITVSDGLWIIILASRGWVGYLAYFGVLVLPLLVLYRVSRKREIGQVTVTMGMIMAANLAYLIPNSTLSPVGWLLSGALWGFVSTRPVAVEDAMKSDPGAGRRARYSRFESGAVEGQENAGPDGRIPRYSRFSRG